MKPSFILHKDMLSVIELMTDDMSGKLIKAILHYQKHGVLPELDFTLRIAIQPFISQFERDALSYEATCIRNKNNGSMGGRPKNNPSGFRKTQKTQVVSGKPTITHNNPSEPKKPDNDNDNDNGKDNDNEKEKRGKIPILDEVKQYCAERNRGVNPEKWFDFYASKGWMIGKNKMRDWRAAVRTWEKNENKPNQVVNKVHLLPDGTPNEY